MAGGKYSAIGSIVGGIIGGIIAGVATPGLGAIAGAIYGIGVGGALGATADVFTTKKPSLGKDLSNAYSDNPSNIITSDSVVPVIYGHCFVYPLICYHNQNTLDDWTAFRMLAVLGEGYLEGIVGRNVKANGMWILEYANNWESGGTAWDAYGSSEPQGEHRIEKGYYYFYPGSSAQTLTGGDIVGFKDQHFNSRYTDGTIGVGQSRTHSTPNQDSDGKEVSNINEAEVRITFPDGIGVKRWDIENPTGQNKKKKYYNFDKDNPLTINYQIEYRVAGSSAVWTNFGTFSSSGNSDQRRNIRHTISFPALDKYAIKVTKTSLSSASYSEAWRDAVAIEKMRWTETEWTKEFTGMRYTSFMRIVMSIGPTMATRLNAFSQGGIFPISAEVKGLRIHDFNNLSGAEVYSNNPSSCVYDFLTNQRYGVSNDSEILTLSSADFDLPSWKAAAIYCDEIINGRKRFELNYVIDTKKPVVDHLTDMLINFNAFIVNSEGKLKLIIDKWEASVRTIDEANMVQGSFWYEPYPPLYETPNQVIIKFINGDVTWEQTHAIFNDYTMQSSAGRVVSVTHDCNGITYVDQASTVGWYLLRSGIHAGGLCGFKLGANEITNEIGDVIAVTHSVPGWVTPKKFRIIGMNEDENGDNECTCREHVEFVYSASSADIVFPPLSSGSILPSPFATPPDLYEISLEEDVEVLDDGTQYSTILVKFEKPVHVINWDHAEIWVAKYTTAADSLNATNRDYVIYGNSDSGLFRFKAETLRTYNVKALSVSSRGLTSSFDTAASATITTQGITVPPDAVHFIDANCFYRKAIYIEWTPSQDVDFGYYELRTDTNFSSTATGLVYFGKSTSYTWTPSDGSSAAYTYYLGTVDKSGNISTEHGLIAYPASGYTYDAITIVNAAPAVANLRVVSFQGTDCTITWDNVDDDDIQSYTVKIYTAADKLTLISSAGNLTETTYIYTWEQMIAENNGSPRQLLYFQVIAYDRFGNTGSSEITAIPSSVNLPTPTGLEIENQGNNILFYTNDVKFKWNYVALNSGLQSSANDDAVDLTYLDRTFLDYMVEIWVSGVLKRTEYTKKNVYTYTYENNILDNSVYAWDDVQKQVTWTTKTVARVFTVKVYTRSVFGLSAEYSSPTSLEVENPSPTAPLNITLTSNRTGNIDLKWDVHKDPDVTGYEVHSSAATGFTPSETSLVYRGRNNFFRYLATPNITHYFRVGAFDSFVSSADKFSTQLSKNVTTSVDTVAPGQVTGLTLIAGFQTLGLSWTALTDSASSRLLEYEIYAADNSGFSTNLKTYRARTNAFKEQNLTPNQTRYYKVRGINSAEQTGSFSSTVSGTTIYINHEDINVANLGAIKAILGSVTIGASMSSAYLKTFNKTGFADGSVGLWYGESSANVPQFEIYHTVNSFLKYDGVNPLEFRGGITITSSAGQRIEINTNNSNEMYFYGNRGDGVIEKLASRGILASGSDWVIDSVGSSASTMIAYYAQGNVQTGLGTVIFARNFNTNNNYMQAIMGYADGANNRGLHGYHIGSSAIYNEGAGLWAYSQYGYAAVFDTDGKQAQVHFNPNTSLPSTAFCLSGDINYGIAVYNSVNHNARLHWFDSAQWVPFATCIVSNGNPYSTSRIAYMYYDTADDKLKIYTGSAWMKSTAFVAV